MSFIASLESSSLLPRIRSSLNIRTWERQQRRWFHSETQTGLRDFVWVLFYVGTKLKWIMKTCLVCQWFLPAWTEGGHLQKRITYARHIMFRRVTRHDEVLQDSHQLRNELQKDNTREKTNGYNILSLSNNCHHTCLITWKLNYKSKSINTINNLISYWCLAVRLILQ